MAYTQRTMASHFCKLSLLLFLFSSLVHFHIAICAEYEVNGEDGWVVPKHDGQIFNKWASSNRFKVEDTVHFKYRKDSVLVVTEEEYDKCQPSHPQFFSNNGDTVFKLDRSGSFYFISGVTGHCQRGQKMIIKVLETESTPPPSQNQNSSNNAPETEKNGAVEVAAVASSTIMLLVISAFG